MGRQLKAFLAQQIRSLRGEYSQKEFGGIIGKPQSVVSRLEKQADRHISIQTLIDIAARLDIAVIVRFVDYPTFLRYTDDYSESAIAPARYSQAAIDALVHATDSTVRESALKALFGGIPDQAHGASALEAPANDIAPTFSEGDGDTTLSAAMRQTR
jgi:transcriptional regulator with XRE-family HTH domain